MRQESDKWMQVDLEGGTWHVEVKALDDLWMKNADDANWHSSDDDVRASTREEGRV